LLSERPEVVGHATGSSWSNALWTVSLAQISSGRTHYILPECLVVHMIERYRPLGIDLG
jgi:hypothetical protein